jgi:hypothetical protein
MFYELYKIKTIKKRKWRKIWLFEEVINNYGYCWSSCRTVQYDGIDLITRIVCLTMTTDNGPEFVFSII